MLLDVITHFSWVNGTYLKIRGTVIEQFQHVPDVLSVLDNEVQLHVEFSADQLQQFQEQQTHQLIT